MTVCMHMEEVKFLISYTGFYINLWVLHQTYSKFSFVM
jgi:hypothetical protein